MTEDGVKRCQSIRGDMYECGRFVAYDAMHNFDDIVILAFDFSRYLMRKAE
jgi:hypothetical protein